MAQVFQFFLQGGHFWSTALLLFHADWFITDLRQEDGLSVDGTALQMITEVRSTTHNRDNCVYKKQLVMMAEGDCYQEAAAADAEKWFLMLVCL